MIERESHPRLQPYPAAMYRAMIFFALLLTGRGLYECSAKGGRPDERGPEEMARAYLESRYRLRPKSIGPVTDERVRNLTNFTKCLRKAIKFPPDVEGVQEEAAEAPDGGARIDGGAEAVVQNEEGQRFFTCQGGSAMPVKFVYQPNTGTYVSEKFLGSTAENIRNQINDAATKDTLTWMETEDPQTLLTQPVACVENRAGDCLQTWDGADCLLLKPLAKAVTEASLQMENDGKGPMDPIACTRSDFHQIMAWSARIPDAALGFYTGKSCVLYGTAYGRTFPGMNHHAMGLSLDLANQKEAAPYLAKIGVACSPITFDLIEQGHCALGDKYLMGDLKSTLKKK